MLSVNGLTTNNLTTTGLYNIDANDITADTITCDTLETSLVSYNEIKQLQGINTNATIQTQLNNITGNSGNYVTLNTSQNITAQKTFNNVLPTTTLTPNSDDQFITRIYADGRYGELGTANAWTSTNTFNSPVTFSDGSIVKLDANNNMYVGVNAGSSLALGGIINAFFGLNSGLHCRGSYNVALGYGTLSSSQGTSIGNGYLQGNCCFGYNAGAYFSGTSSQTVYNNTCVGLWSGQYHQLGDNNTFIGYAAGSDGLGNWNDSIAIGTFAHIFGNNQIVLGRSTEMTYPMGGLTIPSQQQLILQDRAKLASCQFLGGAIINLSFSTDEHVILQDASTIIINLPTPNPTDTRNVGAKFYIIRAITSTNDITIKVAVGQTIGQGQYDGSISPAGSYLLRKGESQVSVVCIAKAGMTWMVINTSLSQATDNLFVSSVIPNPSTNYGLTFGGLSASQYYPQFSDTTNLNYKPDTQTLTAKNVVVTGTVSATFNGNINITDQTSTATTFYPTFVSATSGNLGINAGSNLQYRPDTQSLLLSSGTFEGYKSRSTCFQYLTQNTLITGATTLTNPLRSYYPFTMKTATAYTIILPEVTALNVGTQITFKRIGGSLQPLTIQMSANQPAFLLTNSVGQLANFILCSTVQSCGTMVAIQCQDEGTGTFSNNAGTSMITINTQTSGTLCIGGRINCNGNNRYITSYAGGLGGINGYNINSIIVANNSNQTYTSSISYGWAVTSVQ